MSLWGNLSGYIRVHKSNHLSLRKFFEDMFDGEDFNLAMHKLPSSGNTYLYEIEISIEGYGEDLWEMFKFSKAYLIDRGCECDLKVEVHL